MLQISSVLGSADLQQINAVLDTAPFVDGKLSAGTAAKPIKNNEEVDQSADVFKQLSQFVMSNLTRHPKFRNYVLPHRLSSPFFARYTQGMGYGDHIDDPVMGSPHHFRTDISCTVFLNDPDDYDGGDLVIHTPFGEDMQFKLPAGHAIVYPSGSLHQVAEVTGGERRVMVLWVQSLIRSEEQRQLLFELGQVRDRMLRKAPGQADTKSLDHVYINLVRQWAEV